MTDCLRLAGQVEPIGDVEHPALRRQGKEDQDKASRRYGKRAEQVS